MHSPPVPSSDSPLTQLCLAHATREEEALRAALEALDGLQTALARGAPQEQESALACLDAAARVLDGLRGERIALRARLADELRVPPGAVTMTLLSGRAGAPLRQARDRLLALAAEVGRRAARAAALSRAGAEATARLLASLTGAPSTPQRYGRAGTVNSAPCGSLIQARG